MGGDDGEQTYEDPPSAGGARKTFWRSQSWSSSRTEQSNPSSNIRCFQPPPLTPRPQNSKARACLPPLQPLSIARRSLDEWPKAGSDDVGEWPQPPTPSGRPDLKIELPPIRSQGCKNQIAHFDKECSKVADHIYLGGDSVARNREILRQNGITHVLNCVGFVCPEYFKSDLIYKTLWLQDSPSEDITSILYDVFDYFEDVREQGGRVFVHCCQGVSRSTSLVIAYLMWRKGQSFDDAFQFVKAARGIANPNMGFACQLLQCQKRVHAIPLSPNSVLRMYRMAPHSPYDPLHLVPKMLNDPNPEALDSRGAFIVHVLSSIYIWIGKNCHPVMEKDAKAAAFQVVRYEKVQGPIITVDEGEEPSEFWEAFSSSDKVNKDQFQLGSKGGVGMKSVDSYDVDFERFYKAITGGVVPPFPSSGPGHETHLPARESNWSILRRKFISGTICRIFSDSTLVKDGDPRVDQVQFLSSESLTSPPYLSPSSVSSDSSASSKSCSDSPTISPSTCSSPSLTPSPASSNSLGSSLPPSKPSLHISNSLEHFKPCTRSVSLPSKGLARSIAERRGSFSLKLPLNKDTSSLTRTTLNGSSVGPVPPEEVLERINGNGHACTTADGSEGTGCAGEAPDINCTSRCAPDSSENHVYVQNSDLLQDGNTVRRSTRSVEINLKPSSSKQLLVYRWPNMEKLAQFGREDLDSKAVLLILTPSRGSGGEFDRMLYLWIGSSVEHTNGHSCSKIVRNLDGVTEVDWTQVARDFLSLMGLPKDLPIKVVKEQEPEEILKLLSSDWKYRQ